MSLPTMHHTDSKALPILQFTALHAVVRQRTLEIELEESPELLSEALFERCAPAPFWSEGGAKLCFSLPLPEGVQVPEPPPLALDGGFGAVGFALGSAQVIGQLCVLAGAHLTQFGAQP